MQPKLADHQLTRTERMLVLSLLYARLPELQNAYDSADRRHKRAIRAERKRLVSLISKFEPGVTK